MVDGTICHLDGCANPAYHLCDYEKQVMGIIIFKGCGRPMCKKHTSVYDDGLYQCNDKSCKMKPDQKCFHYFMTLLCVVFLTFAISRGFDAISNPNKCFIDANGLYTLTDMRSLAVGGIFVRTHKDICGERRFKYDLEKTVENN